MTSKDTHHEICILPRAVNNAKIWSQLRDKLKMLRLTSLQQDPEAFSSTYAEEVKFSNEIWEKRMTNPLAVHFIAVQRYPKTESDGLPEEASALLSGDWLGLIVLVGPKEDGTVGLHASRSPWENPSSKSTMSEERDRKKASTPAYQLNGVFVVPDARGLGLGKKLVEAATQLGISSAKNQGFHAIRIQVRAEANNRPARMLYRSGGYTDCGVETYTTKEKEKDGIKIPSTVSTCIVMERLEEFS